MSITLLSFYILVWPVLAMGVLTLLCIALVRDIRAARRKGTGLV
ncbi:MAG: putative transporter small subunit [Luteimonas sp.]